MALQIGSLTAAGEVGWRPPVLAVDFPSDGAYLASGVAGNSVCMARPKMTNTHKYSNV